MGEMNKPPNPGSELAVAVGCLCPIMDNHHGMGIGSDKFWISEDCPIHASKSEESPHTVPKSTVDYELLFNWFHMYLTPDIPPEDLTADHVRSIARKVEDYEGMKKIIRRRLR